MKKFRGNISKHTEVPYLKSIPILINDNICNDQLLCVLPIFLCIAILSVLGFSYVDESCLLSICNANLCQISIYINIQTSYAVSHPYLNYKQESNYWPNRFYSTVLCNVKRFLFDSPPKRRRSIVVIVPDQRS